MLKDVGGLCRLTAHITSLSFILSLGDRNKTQPALFSFGHTAVPHVSDGAANEDDSAIFCIDISLTRSCPANTPGSSVILGM